MVSAIGTEVMGENELGHFTSQIGRAPSAAMVPEVGVNFAISPRPCKRQAAEILEALVALA
jgi:hypothetical protein